MEIITLSKILNYILNLKTPIPMYIAGLGKQSAMLAGEQGNGFVTTELNVDSIKNILFPALKEGGSKSWKKL